VEGDSSPIFLFPTALLVTQERLDLIHENNEIKSLEIINLYDEQGISSGTKVIVRIPISQIQFVIARFLYPKMKQTYFENSN